MNSFKLQQKKTIMLNEDEMRKIIDEQLRKVGWEADSYNLRYSKGTRPHKGQNIAIAEWQNDSGFFIIFCLQLLELILAEAGLLPMKKEVVFCSEIKTSQNNAISIKLFVDKKEWRILL